MSKNWYWITAMLVSLAMGSGFCTYSQEADNQLGMDPTAFVTPEGLQGTGEAVPEGAQPVLRGPVHEAFAQPSRVKPQPGPIVPKEPPKPIEEIPPDQKPAGDNVQWIAGYWFWDEEKQEFLWVSGIWRAIPPGMEWVPGTWVRVEGGWQWIPGYWKPVAQKEVEVVPEPPEPPPLAEPPPAPGPDYFYVPGTWVYMDYRWYWRPGVWVLYRPGWIWVPACYYWTPYGYVFVDGYWDYPFRYRGWLFCPVWVDFAVCYRPGWFWRPCYWVPEPCLTSFLFVHTRRFCFFFGDFYDPFYTRAGFVSIYYYRVHRHCYDPIVSYYALAYRQHDPNWLARQRVLTQARIQGAAPRPPRTLEEQRRLLASAAGDPERQAKLRQLVVAGSVSHVNTKTVPVQKLDNRQIAATRQAIDELRQAEQRRSEVERKLIQAKPELGKRPIRVEPVAVKSTATVQTVKTPPPPVVSKPQSKAPPPTTSKPADSSLSKPTQEKTKPTTSKPIEEKTKPSPTKPGETKTPPPTDKTPPTTKPGSSQPKETPKTPPRPIEEKPKPTLPSQPDIKPSPSKPTPEKSPARPVSPREGNVQPGPTRPEIEVPTRPGVPERPRSSKPLDATPDPDTVRPPREIPQLPSRSYERPQAPIPPPTGDRSVRPQPPPSDSPRIVPSVPHQRFIFPERSAPPSRGNEKPSRERSRGSHRLQDTVTHGERFSRQPVSVASQVS